ncbi:cupin domain-containing protein [Roseibium suaedae]|uniref:(S)-ureidoglycine aminohydrolase cupin domain-containing protein n=1 Tax=Roseibium suaedae TaxID=735517 RepID=A0A1M7MZR6_9HYPH|nr:cupin domain-containing protein [Roseibium suaedae]SHM96723.1 hypothetical protein SAMN05444272_3634 [Roseibium suaedae]
MSTQNALNETTVTTTEASDYSNWQKDALAETQHQAGQLPVNSLFTLAALDPAKLKPAPIRPHWILEGNPEAKCVNLSNGTRGWTSTDHWSCTAGKFRWHYGWDETVLFVEGAVRITDDAGTVYEGRPGVSLFFPAGTSATWEVPNYIRKIAFNQRPVPVYLDFPARVIRKLQRIAGLEGRRQNGL